jgi:cobalt transporter subunit CbtA
MGTTTSQIFVVALIGGLIAGVFLTGAQQLAVTPIILEAETYEMAGQDGAAAAEDEAGEPEGGAERLIYSAIANIVTAVGLGLLLSAAFVLRGRRVGWRGGLLWGLAGFAAFNLAPALGLPPEIPGAAAAPLIERQVWWVATVALTAGGLALIIFSPRVPLKAIGLVLIVGPHIVGAPQPDAHGGLAPGELEIAFVYASLITNAVFWLVLGVLAGVLFNRFQPAAAG